jgi:hypothetical protein
MQDRPDQRIEVGHRLGSIAAGGARHLC